MSFGDPWAVRLVDLLKPSSERIAVRIELGPVWPDGPDWCCRVRFHGWIESPPDIRGRDSMEATLLALGLVHGILVEFVQRGGRILWAGTSRDCDLVEFVSSPEWKAPRGADTLRSSGPRQQQGREPGRKGLC